LTHIECIDEPQVRDRRICFRRLLQVSGASLLAVPQFDAHNCM
jgi:hypothetical protein